MSKSKISSNKVADFKKLLPIIKKYKEKSGSLITILQRTQELYGYLPREALEYISNKTQVPLVNIYGVSTFYSQFHLKLRGKHIIRICEGTACHVRGADEIFSIIKEILGVDKGETTKDFKFTLESVACLGVCYLAPVMMIDDNYFGKLDPTRIKEILNDYMK